MAFMDGKDGSKGFVKRVASSFSMKKKKNAIDGGAEPKFLPRSKSTGSTNYESTKKTTRIIKSSVREKIDDRGGLMNKRFGKWRSFDDNDSIWLSSDCASPTEEGRFSVSFRFRVDENVVSWLSSIANSCLPLNHQEVRRIPKNIEDNAENIEKKGLKEDSSSLDSSSTQSLQGKKVSFSPSLGTELETVKSSSASPTISSGLKNDTATSLVDENSVKIVESKKSRNVVEPLFWPYDQRFDWTPEDILKHFSMSPQKKKSLNVKVSAGGSQLLQTRKTDLKDCKRKLVFNGTPVNNTSKIPELKRTISNGSHKKNNNIKTEPIKNCVKRNKSLPSRLRKSSKTCSKIVPIEVAEEEEARARKLMNRRSKTMVEDDFVLLNDFSIENAVGLGEFNGREGIDSEFNSDTFLFDDSL